MAQNDKTPVSIPSLKEIQRERKRIRREAYYRQALRSTVSVLLVVAAVAVLIATLFLPILLCPLYDWAAGWLGNIL